MTDKNIQDLSRERAESLADEERFEELAIVLDRESKRSKLELWQLVLKSRAIQLSDGGAFELEDAHQALAEALERERHYVPAMVEMAHYLDVHEAESDKATELFRQAADVVLEQLVDVLRGWAEAKLLEGEVRKELLLSYNRLLESLRSLGLEAGKKAERIDWFDPAQYGGEL